MSEAKDHEINFIHDEPSVIENLINNSVTRTYRWETPDKRNIFLHLVFSLETTEKQGSFFVCHSNIDSSEVKGQGKFLWEFMTSELEKTAKKGFKDVGSVPVMHIVSPNDYSRKYVENNPSYFQKGEDYYSVYK
jgi:hypothetical protein